MERREFMGKQQKTTDRQIPKKKRRKASRFHMALALFIAMYLTFTVNPPHISLFLDSSTGTYGIPPRNLDAGAVYLDALKEI